MKVENLVKIIGADFYTGVPDSQLKALCNYLIDKYGIDPKHHLIAANEGNCTALAAGYHLATGKVPVVYMQNSGEGNIINPVASLLNDKVYAIPMIFIIGWRGEPGVHDEPQHIYQGEITVKLLELMGIKSFVIRKDTTDDEVSSIMAELKAPGEKVSSAAFAFSISCKSALRTPALTLASDIFSFNAFTLAYTRRTFPSTAGTFSPPAIDATAPAVYSPIPGSVIRAS